MIAGLLKESPASVQEIAAQAATRFALTAAAEPLFTLATDAKAGPLARIAALQGLATLKDSRLPQAARTAMSDKDPAVRTQGLQMLSDADPASAVKLIGEIVNTGVPQEKQGASSR